MTSKTDYFKSFCEISKAFGTTLEKQELLNLIVQSAIDTMGGKAASLFLADEKEDMFVPVAQKGLSENYLHAGPSNAKKIVGNILKGGGYLSIRDATTDPRVENHEVKKAEGIASILDVPVMVKGKAIGVLALYTSTPRDFAQDEIEFLSALADQGGIAIENARLVDRIRMNTELFHDLAVTINSTLDIKEIMHIMSADVAETLGVKAASIRLMDENRDKLEIVSSYGLSEKYLSKGPISAEKGISEALRNRPVVIRDVATDKGVQYREEKKAEGIVSILSVPINARDDVIGVMRLYSDVPREFTEADIMMAVAMAHQGGLAIQNASMYLTLQQDKNDLEAEIWTHRSWF
ncbi:MAG TPA: GAF domain-containing protein [Desulfobacterales bacterium]|nr:GAF domain-containing protein [Desulfobacterales bacterium]